MTGGRTKSALTCSWPLDNCFGLKAKHWTNVWVNNLSSDNRFEPAATKQLFWVASQFLNTCCRTTTKHWTIMLGHLDGCCASATNYWTIVRASGRALDNCWVSSQSLDNCSGNKPSIGQLIWVSGQSLDDCFWLATNHWSFEITANHWTSVLGPRCSQSLKVVFS